MLQGLNEIYRTTPALYQIDESWDGFQWIQANDSDNSIVAFLRTDKRGNSLLCVTNFMLSIRSTFGLPQMPGYADGVLQHRPQGIRRLESVQQLGDSHGRRAASGFPIQLRYLRAAARNGVLHLSARPAAGEGEEKRALSRKSQMFRQRKHPKPQKTAAPAGKVRRQSQFHFHRRSPQSGEERKRCFTYITVPPTTEGGANPARSVRFARNKDEGACSHHEKEDLCCHAAGRRTGQPSGCPD